MPEFQPGTRVEANISKTLRMLGDGVITPATVLGPGDAPGTYKVQTDTEFNGVNLFEVEADRLRAINADT